METNHYHHVAGEVTFTDPAHPGHVGNLKLNALIITADGKITSRHVNHSLSMLAKRAKDQAGEQIEVHDVFIYGFSSLGQMTDQEFNPELAAANDENETEAA